MLERAQNNPALKEIVDDVRVFVDLKEHEGWTRLYTRFQEQRANLMLRLASRLMAGTEVTQKQIDFHRGFFAGVRAVLELPSETVASLEAAAERAWEQALAEQLSELEGQQPYT